jgi:mono/diheme cytochrome c family protein
MTANSALVRPTDYSERGLEQPLGARTPAQPAPLQLEHGNELELEQGAAIYGRRCVSCHGRDGRGNEGRLAPNFAQTLSRLKKPEADLIESVSRGIPMTAMRGFAKELSPKEIRDVVGYLRHRFDTAP